MALIFPDSVCAICCEPLGSAPIFATSGVFFSEGDPLFPFCDAPMHWSCYAEWPARERFARAYFELWTELEKTNPYWAKVYGDELVFVSVRLVCVSPDNELEVAVWLAKTGTDIRVRSSEWTPWLDGGAAGASDLHALEIEAVREALPRLKSAIPSMQQAIQLVDWNRKHMLSKVLKREKSNRDQERYNAKSRAAHVRIEQEGLSCPHCGTYSRDFRFLDGGEDRKSYFICRSCNRSFGIHDFGQ
jgi:hypothetical protein